MKYKDFRQRVTEQVVWWRQADSGRDRLRGGLARARAGGFVPDQLLSSVPLTGTDDKTPGSVLRFQMVGESPCCRWIVSAIENNQG